MKQSRKPILHPGGGEQTAAYKILNVHPIINGILDKLAFFRTHAAAVWYNKLAGRTVADEIGELKARMVSFKVSGEFVAGESNIDCSQYIPAGYRPVSVIAQLRSANTIVINSAHMVGNVLNVTARMLTNGTPYVGNSAGPINCIVSCEKE